MVPRVDLQDTPLDDPALILVDRSYAKNSEGKYQAGCAVTTQNDLIEKGILPQFKSAQPSEGFAPI